jgi:Family of unknown function (DUF6527)
MRLTDLNPQFLNAGGEHCYTRDAETGALLPAPERKGVGVVFDCPCGNHDEEHRCFVPFKIAIDGMPSGEPKGWQRTGDTFETLTLEPSILRIGGCGWHGWIRNGEVVTC